MFLFTLVIKSTLCFIIGKGGLLLLQGDAATYNFDFLTEDEEAAVVQLLITSVGSDFSLQTKKNQKVTKNVKLLFESFLAFKTCQTCDLKFHVNCVH